MSTTGNQVVWCELSTDLIEPATGAQSHPQELLPLAGTAYAAEERVGVMNDSEILRRVRDRLRDPGRSSLLMWPNLLTIWN
jgi:hypothetical protein